MKKRLTLQRDVVLIIKTWIRHAIVSNDKKNRRDFPQLRRFFHSKGS